MPRIMLFLIFTLIGCRTVEQTEGSQLAGSATRGKTKKIFLNHPPMIFIHASGIQTIALKAIKMFGSNLEKVGFNPKKMHYLKYNWKQTDSDISTELYPDFLDITSQYPDNTKFIVVGHSLGHYAALYTIASNNLFAKVEMLVGLGGVARGAYFEDTKAPFLVGGLVKRSPACAVLLDKEYMTQFHETYRVHIKQMKKCSLYSRKDMIVVNKQSSVFEDRMSKGVEILKDVQVTQFTKIPHHAMVAGHSEAAQAFKVKCYLEGW